MKKVLVSLTATAALLLSHFAQGAELTPDGYYRYVFYYNFANPINQFVHELTQERKSIHYEVVLDVQLQVTDNLVLLITDDAMQHPSQLVNNGMLIADDYMEAN